MKKTISYLLGKYQKSHANPRTSFVYLKEFSTVDLPTVLKSREIRHIEQTYDYNKRQSRLSHYGKLTSKEALDMLKLCRQISLKLLQYNNTKVRAQMGKDYLRFAEAIVLISKKVCDSSDMKQDLKNASAQWRATNIS